MLQPLSPSQDWTASLAEASVLTFPGCERCTPAPPTSVSQPMEPSISSHRPTDRPEEGTGARSRDSSGRLPSSRPVFRLKPRRQKCFYLQAALWSVPSSMATVHCSTSWETLKESLKGPLEAFPLHGGLSEEVNPGGSFPVPLGFHSHCNPPNRLAAGALPSPWSQCRVGFHHNNSSLSWCPFDL